MLGALPSVGSVFAFAFISVDPEARYLALHRPNSAPVSASTTVQLLIDPELSHVSAYFAQDTGLGWTTHRARIHFDWPADTVKAGPSLEQMAAEEDTCGWVDEFLLRLAAFRPTAALDSGVWYFSEVRLGWPIHCVRGTLVRLDGPRGSERLQSYNYGYRFVRDLRSPRAWPTYIPIGSQIVWAGAVVNVLCYSVLMFLALFLPLRLWGRVRRHFGH